ncbi:MAG: hypothetical protein II468_00425, partial [Lachnospiraceae bacterium]|nr:hypothetical protein [Lachnospiraceae bacterium]
EMDEPVGDIGNIYTESKSVNQKPQQKNISEIKWNAADEDYVNVIKAKVNDIFYEDIDLNDALYSVICAVQDISRIRYYGLTLLCDFLRAVENYKITDNGLDKLPQYGIFKKYSYYTIRSIVEWMISEHYLLQTKGNYPVLHSTYEGLHYSESINEGKLKRLKRYLEVVTTQSLRE